MSEYDFFNSVHIIFHFLWQSEIFGFRFSFSKWSKLYKPLREKNAVKRENLQYFLFSHQRIRRLHHYQVFNSANLNPTKVVALHKVCDMTVSFQIHWQGKNELLKFPVKPNGIWSGTDIHTHLYRKHSGGCCLICNSFTTHFINQFK